MQFTNSRPVARNAVLVALLALCFALFVSPAQADNDRKHKNKHKHKHKHRVEVCHANKNGIYKLKRLSPRAAHAHLKRHDHDVEPVNGKCPQPELVGVCKFTMKGTYKLKYLPIHRATRYLMNHDMAKVPTVGADGTESCDSEPARESTCKVAINGQLVTIAEHVAIQNVGPVNLRADSDSCDLRDANGFAVAGLYNNDDNEGVNVFFYVAGSGAERTDITTQAQYDDCAFDFETIGNPSDTCPAVQNVVLP